MEWHYYFMAMLYFVAGVFHFLKPKAFMRVMPRYIPYHRTIVYISGLAEILIALSLCIHSLKTYALIGLILMLISFFPVHIYMITNEKAGLNLPKWVLYLRLLIQFVLIYWAYSYLQ